MSDFGELSEGGLEIFDDFGGDDVGVGKLFVFHIDDSMTETEKRL
jgi:hypothetical protein